MTESEGSVKKVVLEKLVESVLAGDKRSIARCMSIVEDDGQDATELMHRLYSRFGNAYRIGITGPPGAGKSTLTSQLIRLLRNQEKKVGVIAVDPTSPFSGGAVLGDRIRMSRFATDPGVFIRSMASRGSMGGLAQKAQDAADVLDAAGMDVILFETVGVGQTELDIADAADTTVVVLVPESGDSVQAMKAGLMEIADIFALNKSDREGADRLKSEIEMMLHMRSGLDCERDWNPPVVKTIATTGEGVQELLDRIRAHENFLRDRQLLLEKRKRRLVHKIRELVKESLEDQFWNEKRQQILEAKILDIISHRLSPYQLVSELLTQKE